MRNWEVYINDIYLCIKRIIEYTEHLSFEEFLQDNKTYDAVLRNLGIMGEAVKNIPEEIRENYNQTEWKKIAGLRDIVVHDYFGINDEIIWDIVKNKIPELRNSIESIIQDLK
jgi:uncharacterized protein with HEPN domain